MLEYANPTKAAPPDVAYETTRWAARGPCASLLLDRRLLRVDEHRRQDPVAEQRGPRGTAEHAAGGRGEPERRRARARAGLLQRRALAGRRAHTGGELLLGRPRGRRGN